MEFTTLNQIRRSRELLGRPLSTLEINNLPSLQLIGQGRSSFSAHVDSDAVVRINAYGAFGDAELMKLYTFLHQLLFTEETTSSLREPDTL